MMQNETRLPDQLKQQISDALKASDPEKVILFGSYAWGHATEDSDIDLYVVTRDDFMPTTWRQKRDIVRRVSDHIGILRASYPIDLLVHTKPMHEEFVARNSYFAHEIMTRGRRLL